MFGGRGPAGSKVQLYVDNNAYGLAFINDKGTWTFAGLSPLAVGTHTIRAHEIGDDGAVKSRIEMPFYREDPTKVAAKPPPAPATPEAPKPAEVATVQEVPVITPPVDTKKRKDIAAPDQSAVEKNAMLPAEEPTAPVERKKKKKDAAAPEQKAVEKSVEAPAEEQTVPPISKKKKKAKKPVNTAQKGQPKCDPVIADCAPAQTPSKLKQQSTIRVIPKTNLPDVGAENWRVECSARFGGWSKASETYVSSSGKRVSCAFRPKNARG